MFHNKRPLIFLLVTLVGSGLVAQQSIGLFSAFASENSHLHDVGYDRGCKDAGLPQSERYMTPEREQVHSYEYCPRLLRWF